MKRSPSTAEPAAPADSPQDAPSLQFPTLRWRSGAALDTSDALVVEEPLEIRLGGRRFTLTMRTPGHDEELAAGFLFAEGFINSAAELGEIRRMRDRKGAPDPNAIDAILVVAAGELRQRLKRNLVVSSSCGVCGKTTIEAITRRLAPVDSAWRVAAALLGELPAAMRAAQQVFAATGGLHAAALFDRRGNLRLLREDIGRHNAVDKLVGHALLHQMMPLSDSILMVSGRLSFEIVQKSTAAGIPVLAGISAPSSLAVQLAEEAGVTLIGFVRDQGFNLYCHRGRVNL